MNTLIVYDSQFGNSEWVARAIAAELGSAWILRADEADPLDLARCDLLIVGGPTHRNGASPALRELCERLPRGALKGIPAATFDTRCRLSDFLTDSAAGWIASRLTRAGARLVAPPKSFFIERDPPPQGEKRRHETERLAPSEAEEAAGWARRLAATTIPVA